MDIRKNLRRLRDTTPGKKPIFELLRRTGCVPEQLWRHLIFEGAFESVVQGVSFRMHHGGTVVENRLFWMGAERGWEPMTTKLWATMARSASLVADIGANTGFFSILAASQNHQASVIAVEPSDIFFSILEKSIALNPYSNIRAHKTAVTNRIGYVNFDGWKVCPEDAATKRVSATTLDTLLNNYNKRGALIKIDAEGHEPAVLAGAASTLAARPTLIVEVLDDTTGGVVSDLLRGTDYHAYGIDEHNMRIFLLNKIKKGPGRNLLLYHPDGEMPWPAELDHSS